MSRALRAMLAAGRHRLSLGETKKAVDWVVEDPRQLAAVVELLWDEDRGVAGRAAHVLSLLPQKEQRRLDRWREELLGLFDELDDNKTLWLMAGLLPRLKLNKKQALRLAERYEKLLDEGPVLGRSIVRTMALEGLAQLSLGVLPERRAGVVELLRMAERTGSAAMAARSRHLLKRLTDVRQSGNRHASGD